MTADISAADPHPRQRVAVLDSDIAYVDTGQGAPAVVFLHGNPTSSYLWRNVIPHVAPIARCLAPDLIGMGRSGKNPAGTYRFEDQARYLNAWIDAVLPDAPLFLVIHDWGGALGMNWARRHGDRVLGVAYMESIVAPVPWEDWPEAARDIFKAMRSPAGEEMILKKNVFVERILPASVLRPLTEEEMDAYRAPFREPGEGRRPMLTFPREVPLGGEPADVVELVQAYHDFMTQAPFPKLFINADPAAILIGPQRERCRAWPNQTEITVKGSHFIQEDSPHEIGEAVADFVARNKG